jgi:hypothetical protein
MSSYRLGRNCARLNVSRVKYLGKGKLRRPRRCRIKTARVFNGGAIASNFVMTVPLVWAFVKGMGSGGDLYAKARLYTSPDHERVFFLRGRAMWLPRLGWVRNGLSDGAFPCEACICAGIANLR